MSGYKSGGWTGLYKSSTGLCCVLSYDVSSPGTEPAAAAAGGGGEAGEPEQPRARPPPPPAGTAGPPSLPPG